MPSFRLILAYDGTDYVGWQRQAAGLSIQGVLEDAAAELEGRPVTAHAAGRTDAGVHARGQVVGITLERAIDGPSLVRALNAMLPVTIRVLGAVDTSPEFHARFDAIAKTYQYRLWNGAVMSPFERRYCWHVPPPCLDVEAMATAAAAFEGRHDFAAFQSTGTEVATTERTIFAVRIWSVPTGLNQGRSRIEFGRRQADAVPGSSSGRIRSLDAGLDAALITFEITGDGFLRHMVRAMVGTLVEIGRGRRPAGWVEELLASRDRGMAGQTAPSEGLFLMRVDYTEPSE